MTWIASIASLLINVFNQCVFFNYFPKTPDNGNLQIASIVLIGFYEAMYSKIKYCLMRCVKYQLSLNNFHV
jgi:hypothetical protein